MQGSGASQVKQLYSYDANGDVVSVNYNGTEYYYLRNGQTDIVGLMDGSGTRVVEYTYDAWGKLISTTGTLATSLGADNPFRYRGYYYDTETGLYYLRTRYYDPEVCRFISADVYMTTGQGVLGGNMWAYCGNNPVNRYDDGGEFWHIVIGAAVGAAIGFVSSVASDLISGKSIQEVDWGRAGIAAAFGAISGAVSATGLGSLAQAAISAGLGAAEDAIGQIYSNGGTENLECNAWQCVGSAAIGFASSMFGSNIAKKTNAQSNVEQIVQKAQRRINNGSIKRGLQIAATAKPIIKKVRAIGSIAGSLLVGVSNISRQMGRNLVVRALAA